ncbi:MAG: Type 1 glutamine amidotransferase-like domain-containing protein [Cellulosilyticaceae bacterium]
MGKIVAIGGGELRSGETKAIDEYIVRLSGKERPRLLFIPTASYDAVGYIELIVQYFGELGCEVDCLCLVSESPSDQVVKDKILGADIIYVGGGDTVRMMERWQESKVDVYLKEAYDKGTVLSGLSAGSICWFAFGHSDSESFHSNGTWDYVRAYGLGLIPMAHCPHYNEEGRETFDEMMIGEMLPGIALENQTAFIEIDGLYHVLKVNDQRHAYRVEYRDGILSKEEI